MRISSTGDGRGCAGRSSRSGRTGRRASCRWRPPWGATGGTGHPEGGRGGALPGRMPRARSAPRRVRTWWPLPVSKTHRHNPPTIRGVTPSQPKRGSKIAEATITPIGSIATCGNTTSRPSPDYARGRAELEPGRADHCSGRSRRGRTRHPLRRHQLAKAQCSRAVRRPLLPARPAENHIKSWKTHLAADRTSCTKATANQFRLFLHAGAYWLMWGFACRRQSARCGASPSSTPCACASSRSPPASSK